MRTSVRVRRAAERRVSRDRLTEAELPYLHGVNSYSTTACRKWESARTPQSNKGRSGQTLSELHLGGAQ